MPAVPGISRFHIQPTLAHGRSFKMSLPALFATVFPNELSAAARDLLGKFIWWLMSSYPLIQRAAVCAGPKEGGPCSITSLNFFPRCCICELQQMLIWAPFCHWPWALICQWRWPPKWSIRTTGVSRGDLMLTDLMVRQTFPKAQATFMRRILPHGAAAVLNPLTTLTPVDNNVYYSPILQIF